MMGGGVLCSSSASTMLNDDGTMTQKNDSHLLGGVRLKIFFFTQKLLSHLGAAIFHEKPLKTVFVTEAKDQF